MSFVLVLAAAVTLVVGLLQSGLTLIYLSIGCSVLAGVVLAVAVLRGRPEPRPAAAGRDYSPPPQPSQPAQVPASVGAGAQTTSSFSADPYPSAAPPPPPPPPPSTPPSSGPPPAAPDDAATKAAGTALLGRLRGRRPEPEPDQEPAPAVVAVTDTSEMAVVGPSGEDEDGFPIDDYDRLRATELLSRLPALDRNQLEAVRERESSGKNRFTIMSRIDSLLAAQEEPAWEVDDDEWEADSGADAEREAVLIEAEALRVEDDFGAALDAEELDGEVEDDEVDELVSPVDDFPIAGYDSLTVGRILPRLSDLDAGELAQVRAREQQGRGRGTILDRIDRLASRAGAGALAMPPAAPAARKAPARKAPAVKAPAVKKARVARKPPVPAPPVPAPVAVPVRKARAPKAAAPKATAPTVKSTARTRKAAAPPVPAPPTSTPMGEAVKKARATKAPAKRTTKRP